MSNAFNLKVDSSGIGRLVFDLPDEKVNTFSPPILEELEKQIDALAKRSDIKALLFLSGKESSYVAGANLKFFLPAFKDPSLVDSFLRGGHRVFRKIELLPFPTIAVINGTCVGGGLEFALACTYRIVTDNPKTVVGLPEVSLGIFPGWGGTQRLPRLIGLTNSLPLILGGKTLPAFKAWKLKIADAIIPTEFMDQKVNDFVAQILTLEGAKKIRDKRQPGGFVNWMLEKNPLGRAFVFAKAKSELLKKTKGHYPAPVAALNLVKNSYTLPLQEGLDKEVAEFVNNISTGFVLSKYLIPLFFVSESLKKDAGVPKIEGIKLRPINSTAVLGAGTMGAGIAWLISDHHLPVRLKDISWELLGKGFAHIHSLYNKMVKDKRIKPTEANLKAHQVSTTIDYSGFRDVDLVIEAIVENLDVKKKIFAEVEAQVRPDTIIASNTSSLTIADMSANAQHPERFVGMHFFNPPNKMPLVEIVRGPKTSEEVIASAVSFCKKMGKTPLVVGDCHGFLVNRIFAICANEVMWMLEEGVPMEKLEKVFLNFGMPMSPFILADEVGNDVSYKVTKIFEEAYGLRMHPPGIVKKMYDAQLLGKKVGKGFYLYSQEKATQFNPEVAQFISKNPSELSEEVILDRIIFSMVNEASRCLEEKVITRADYLDMALLMGLGFPPFRGGLLRYADERGIDHVVKRLDSFQDIYGARFVPSPLLRTMAAQHQTFYS